MNELYNKTIKYPRYSVEKSSIPANIVPNVTKIIHAVVKFAIFFYQLKDRINIS